MQQVYNHDVLAEEEISVPDILESTLIALDLVTSGQISTLQNSRGTKDDRRTR